MGLVPGLGTPTAPAPSSAHSYNAQVLQMSEGVVSRLGVLRDRLSGSGAQPALEKKDIPVGVLPMAETALNNLYATTKLLDEIEALVG